MTLLFFPTSGAGTGGCRKVLSFQMCTVTVVLQMFEFNVSLI